MNPTLLVTFWLIVLARITDVSLDTIRTASIIQGRRVFAAVLGFFEAVVYTCAVAKVLLNMNQPVYALREEYMLILLWFLAGYVFVFTAKWDDGAS